MTTSNDQFSGWTEKKFQSIYQSQTCTKKGHGPCLVICCRSDPLQLSKSPVKLRGITLKSMASKLMRCPESCNACTWHWPTEGPNSPHQCPATSHNQCFQSRMNWAITFCLICHIHLTSRWLTTTSSSISTTFCRENSSTISKRPKMLSKSLLNPEAWIFMLQE